MKKLFMFICVLMALAFTAQVVLAEPVFGRKEYKERQTFEKGALFKDSLYGTKFEDKAPIHREPYVINSRSQLSTYSGAGVAGQSIFQLQSGLRYKVDPIAIGYSGVTLILPDAKANNNGTVFIELANTGTTGYQAWAGAATGTTSVYVYPYSAGTTQYYNNASIGVTPQTMFRQVDALIGITKTQTSKAMGSGGGGDNIYFTLDYPHENVEFGLSNSQVSAYVIRKQTLN